LEDFVDGIWKSCPEYGGAITFLGFNGELVCPAYHELCYGTPLALPGQCPCSCNLNGERIERKCHFFSFFGFNGDGCSTMGMVLATRLEYVNVS